MAENNRAQLINVDFNSFQKFETYIEGEAGSEKTVRGYLQDLKQFELFLQETGGSLDNLTRVDIQNYMKHLKKLKRLANTISRHFATIKKFCEFIGRPELAEGIHKRKKQSNSNLAPKTLGKLELLRIFRIVERMKSPRSAAIISMLAYTGVRISELHALNRSDISFKRGAKLKVIGKGDKERDVPFPVEARNPLKAYLDTRTDGHEALFFSNKGSRMAVRTMQDVINKIEKIYNSEVEEKDQIDLHAHLFRHGFATYLVKEEGYDLASVADIMGHEDLQTTRRYAKDSIDDISEKLDDMTLI